MYENPLNQRPSGSQRPPANQPGASAHSVGPSSPNPYAAPAPLDYHPVEVYEEQGSYGLGFVVGLLFALLGLIIIYVSGKEQTKKGALHGFGARIGLVVVFVIIVALTG